MHNCFPQIHYQTSTSYLQLIFLQLYIIYLSFHKCHLSFMPFPILSHHTWPSEFHLSYYPQVPLPLMFSPHLILCHMVILLIELFIIYLIVFSEYCVPSIVGFPQTIVFTQTLNRGDYAQDNVVCISPSVHSNTTWYPCHKSSD